MIGADNMSAKKNFWRMSSSINLAISRPATPVCSMPMVMVILILNFSQREILEAIFIGCSRCSIPPSVLATGTSFIPHIGQFPGEADLTSGCMGQA